MRILGETDFVTRMAAKACRNWHRSVGGFTRQIVLFGSLALIAACSEIPGIGKIPGFGDEETLAKGTVGYIQGFYGGVVADEPHAVLIGRDVLAAGGTAADAAVAMYFMLSVSYPSAAGLGGGGMCLIRDPATRKVETLDFLGHLSTGSAGIPVNVPGNPRGFFALHAKYGTLEWRENIRPAENAARFGVPISRAFATEVAAAGPGFLRSVDGRALFGGNALASVREGVLMKQENLSVLLASIRTRGGGTIYSGAYGRQFAQAAQESGAALSYADLQAFKPKWRSSIEVFFDVRSSFHLPLPRTPVGTMGAKTMALAIGDQRYLNADDGLRAHLLAEAIQRALVDGGGGFKTVTPEDGGARVQLPADYIDGLADSYLEDRVVRLASPKSVWVPGPPKGGQTSFTAVDRNGGAVVCYVTMNKRFGIGRVVRGTGAFLASPASSINERDMSPGLLILARRDKNMMFLAGSASGGAMAQSALVQAALRAAGGTPDDLETAVKWKRLYRDPASAITFVEQGTQPAIINALRQRGHQLQAVPTMGRVNMIFCGSGLPSKKPYCGMRSDPRGFGLATAPSF